MNIKICKEENFLYKIAAWSLVALLTLAIAGTCLYIFLGPYDPGTLSVTGSCGNLAEGGYVNDLANGATYFTEGDSMYCIDSNLNKTIILDAENISHINADKNYIYYISDKKIFSIYNLLTKTQLCDKTATAMSVNGGWIYFTDENGDMFKMSTDGKNIRQLNSVNVTGDFAVDNSIIYFVQGNNLYSIRANGLESTKNLLVRDADGDFSYFNSSIFYRNTKGEICSFNARTGESLVKRAEGSVFNYSYNVLAYIDKDGIVRVNVNTDDTKLYSEEYKDVKIEALFVTSNKTVWIKPEGEDVRQVSLKS